MPPCQSFDPSRFGTSWRVSSAATSGVPHLLLLTQYRLRRRRMRKRRFGNSRTSFALGSLTAIPRWRIAWKPSWLRDVAVPAGTLGSIDTFRFEERVLLAHCGDLVAAKKFDEGLDVIRGREHSFWLDRDVGRKAQWEACRRMAELGSLGVAVRAAAGKPAATLTPGSTLTSPKRDGSCHLALNYKNAIQTIPNA